MLFVLGSIDRSIDPFVISKTPRGQILPPSQDTWTDRNLDPLSKEGTSVNGPFSAHSLRRAGDAHAWGPYKSFMLRWTRRLSLPKHS